MTGTTTGVTSNKVEVEIRVRDEDREEAADSHREAVPVKDKEGMQGGEETTRTTGEDEDRALA